VEPERFEKVRFEVVPAAIRLVLSPDCPLLSTKQVLRGN